MQAEQIAQLRVNAQLDQILAMVAVLAEAVEKTDAYLTSYDVSKPSRIQAETRAAVESAMALLRPRP